MIQRPNAVGLILCHQVIVEAITGNVTLVNSFSRLKAAKFPTLPKELLVYAMLTDGMGPLKLSLIVSRLDNLEDILVQSGDALFTDPLHERRLYIHLHVVRFPVRGKYQVSLLANDEWVAQCSLELVY